MTNGPCIVATRLALILLIHVAGLKSVLATETTSFVRVLEDSGGDGFEVHRVDVRGTAVDPAGMPIPDIKLFVASTLNSHPSGFYRLLGQATYGNDGRFEFTGLEILVKCSQTGPIKKEPAAVFEVFGVSEELGFTWASACTYMPEERTADTPRSENAFYLGDELDVRLVFDKAAKLQGRITDDEGNPIEGTKVQLGYCDSIRRPHSGGTWSCRYLGNTDSDDAPNSFGAVQWLPKRLRETTTNSEGRFEFVALRPDTEYLALINPGEAFDPLQLRIVTADGHSNERKRFVGYSGDFQHSFVKPRDVFVRLVTSSGSPVRGGVVSAHGKKIRRTGVRAESNADGKVHL